MTLTALIRKRPHGTAATAHSEQTVAKTATVAVANPQSMKTDSIETSSEAIEGVILGDKDPIVSPREWYSDFHRFHERLVLRARISTASFSRRPISGFTGRLRTLKAKSTP